MLNLIQPAVSYNNIIIVFKHIIFNLGNNGDNMTSGRWKSRMKI